MADKITYKDIGNFYAEKTHPDFDYEWGVYTPEGEYVGFMNTKKRGGFILYPEEMGDNTEFWVHMTLADVGSSFKNAVRFIYLNWVQLKKRDSSISENKKSRERITYPDIGGYYAHPHPKLARTWTVYTPEGKWIGNFYKGSISGPYPHTYDEVEYSEGGNAFTFEKLDKRMDLKNAVRYIYLRYNAAKKLRDTIAQTISEEWGRDLPGPDPFSPGALGVKYMPEDTSESRWPDTVDYPSFGITAVRKSEEADKWSFVSNDAQLIATYKVNPDNLAKSLKKAAEKAFIKWMGLDDSTVN